MVLLAEPRMALLEPDENPEAERAVHNCPVRNACAFFLTPLSKSSWLSTGVAPAKNENGAHFSRDPGADPLGQCRFGLASEGHATRILCKRYAPPPHPSPLRKCYLTYLSSWFRGRAPHEIKHWKSGPGSPCILISSGEKLGQNSNESPDGLRGTWIRRKQLKSKTGEGLKVREIH